MPEDAYRETTTGVLDRLDCAVLGMRGDAEALSDPPDALMMM
jgi:hypothetical protein